jgi:tetratricopeptide (TPR) repeat protein
MGQVLISYFEAGQICDFIAKQWGEAKLTEMTHAFAGTATTPDVVRQTLGIASEELDKRFLKDLESRNKAVVDNLAQWKKRAVELHELASKGQHADVIARGPAVRDLYPEFVESGSVYETIAASYTAIHNDAGAREELSRYWHAGGRSPAALKQLADLLTAAKQETEAARVLEALLYIAPLDAEVHQKLGSLYLAAKQGAPAAREFQALLAGKPVDEASAHFQLAQAYRVEGRAAQAREELLAALEIAPGFRPAQKMLLETEGVPAR